MALENENHKAHSQETEIKTTPVCSTALYDQTCLVSVFPGDWELVTGQMKVYRGISCLQHLCISFLGLPQQFAINGVT